MLTKYWHYEWNHEPARKQAIGLVHGVILIVKNDLNSFLITGCKDFLRDDAKSVNQDPDT